MLQSFSKMTDPDVQISDQDKQKLATVLKKTLGNKEVAKQLEKLKNQYGHLAVVMTGRMFQNFRHRFFFIAWPVIRRQ